MIVNKSFKIKKRNIFVSTKRTWRHKEVIVSEVILTLRRRDNIQTTLFERPMCRV